MSTIEVDGGPPYVGRFAPSPTGPLHFGSLIAAVGSWVEARRADGQWAVRIEDVDRTRTVAGTADDILRTLEAFGLHWDGPVVYQSERDDAYARALEHLHSTGYAFPCACSRRDVRAAGRKGPAGFIYPGTCREGLPAGQARRSWRFRVAPGPVHFDDALFGPQVTDLAEAIGDFIIRRGDGLFAYHLALVLDDADLGVTDVARGGDLLACTAPQIALQRALGLPTPRYLHLPVAVNAHGRKLSKQTHAPAVDPGDPGPVLHAVLDFLGQRPPVWIRRAPPSETLDWAVAHWRRDTLPRQATLSAPQAHG